MKKALQAIISAALIYLAVTGSDCEKILVSGNIPNEMIGNWKLVEQTGALQDICPDETIDFQSTGVAQLTCPNSASINRSFSVQNDVLTYTETSVSYNLQFLNNNANLLLTGRNISRNLKYEKIATSHPQPTNASKNNSFNSSETEK